MLEKQILFIRQPPTSYAYWTLNILKGMEQEAARIGAKLRELPNAQEAEGISQRHVLLIGHSSQWLTQAAAILKRKGAFPVIVSAYKTFDERFSGVYFSIPSAIEEMIDYLCKAGRRRIAFLGFNPDSPADAAKAQAFWQLTAENGMSGCELFPCKGITMEACVDRLMGRIHYFDAIMCANDAVAAYLMTRLRLAGFRVPEDVFVTGSGNLRLTQMFHLPIATISLNYRELGVQAARACLQMDRELPGAVRLIFLPCELMTQDAAAGIVPSVGTGPAQARLPEGAESYYASPEVSYYNKAEEILQQCDEWDLSILRALLSGATYGEIAEQLHFTDRTIKYRVKRICGYANVASRGELRELFAPMIAASQPGSPQ